MGRKITCLPSRQITVGQSERERATAQSADANRVVKLDGVRLPPFLHPLQHTTTLLSDKMAALSTSAFTGKALVAKAQIRAKASKASVVVKASASDNKSKVSFRD